MNAAEDPPFDINTRSPRPMLSRDAGDNVDRSVGLAGGKPLNLEGRAPAEAPTGVRLRKLRSEDRRDEHLVGAGKRPRDHPGTRAGTRTRSAVRTPPRCASGLEARSPASVSATAVGWCAKSSCNRHAIRTPTTEPPLDAGKGEESSAIRVRADADFGGHRDRRGRIPHVRCRPSAARTRRTQPAAPQFEPGRRAGRLQIGPAIPRRRTLNVWTRDTALAARARAPGLSAPISNSPCEAPG